MWNRILINKGITKFCDNNRINLVKINPEYSSMIGNLMHHAFDPISASAEIARRTLNWIWNKNYSSLPLPKSLQWYPDINGLCARNNMLYDPKYTKGVGTLYKYLCTSGSSYRRPLIKNQMCGYVKFNKGRIVHWTSTNTLLCFD